MASWQVRFVAMAAVAVVGSSLVGGPSAHGAAVSGSRITMGLGVCQDPVCDKDSDGDLIPDVVEEKITNSPTAATGREDANGDGLVDWISILAVGSATGIGPRTDADRDAMPDYIELIMTAGASRTAASTATDSDGRYPADWVSIAICGTPTCATGTEDYDGDGVADARTLTACADTAEGKPGGADGGTGDGTSQGGSDADGGLLARAGAGAPLALAGLALIFLLAGGLIMRQRRAERQSASAPGGES